MRRSLVVSLVLATLLLGTTPARAAWTETTIRNYGDSDSATSSLVIAPNGRTYVAWVSRGGDQLYWAKKTASGWDKRTLTGQNTHTACYSSENDWVGPSAVFGPDGKPRIASVCAAVSAGSKVLYTTKVGRDWVTRRVGDGPSGPCLSSASDVDLINNPTHGRPVIVMTEQCTNSVTGWFQNRRGRWVERTLIPGFVGATRYGALALAVDPANGSLVMVFNSDVYGRGSLLYRDYTWKLENGPGSDTSFDLPGSDVAHGEPDIEFLPDGTAHLMVQEGTPFGTDPGTAYSFLALITRSAGTWGAAEVVDDAVQHTGAEPSLSLTGGTLHVSYHDVTNGDLRYATSPDGSSWSMETIVGPNVTGKFPSLGVTAGGGVRISYHDATITGLRAVTGP